MESGHVEALTIASEGGTGFRDECVLRARAGDLEAFEDLYRREVGRAYALCLRMTSDPGLAEELTQSAFVRAWRNLASFRGESSFGTWLRRLAIHEVLAERRSRGRRRTREREWSEVATGSGADGTDTTGSAIDLERALATLPEGARSVFVLHDIEGYRHEEIAGMLGVATGTTKSQLHRARRLLREALKS
jgi:RNA polymerase sigma-70 factor (ECF subfamily)